MPGGETYFQRLTRVETKARQYREALYALVENHWAASCIGSNWVVMAGDETVGLGPTLEDALKQAIEWKRSVDKAQRCSVCYHLHEEGEVCLTPIGWNAEGEVSQVCGCDNGNPAFIRMDKKKP